MYNNGYSIDDIWKVSGFNSKSSIWRVLNKYGVYLNRGRTSGPRVKSNRTRQNNRPAAHGGKQKGTPPCIAFSPILHIFIWGIIFNSEAMLDIIIVLAGFYLFCGIVRVLLGGFGKSDYQRDR